MKRLNSLLPARRHVPNISHHEIVMPLQKLAHCNIYRGVLLVTTVDRGQLVSAVICPSCKLKASKLVRNRLLSVYQLSLIPKEKLGMSFSYGGKVLKVKLWVPEEPLTLIGIKHLVPLCREGIQVFEFVSAGPVDLDLLTAPLW